MFFKIKRYSVRDVAVSSLLSPSSPVFARRNFTNGGLRNFLCTDAHLHHHNLVAQCPQLVNPTFLPLVFSFIHFSCPFRIRGSIALCFLPRSASCYSLVALNFPAKPANSQMDEALFIFFFGVSRFLRLCAKKASGTRSTPRNILTINTLQTSQITNSLRCVLFSLFFFLSVHSGLQCPCKTAFYP